MKTICFLLAVILISCNNKSGNALPKSQTNVLTGNWTLRKCSPGFAPQETFNQNDIIWQFYQNNTVAVTINIALPITSGVPIKTNTMVFYNLVNNETVTIENVVYNISFQYNKLILDNNSASDGTRLEFDKI